jgi:hypothetical protein
MPQKIDVVVTSEEAHNLIHLVFKIDRMWRRLASAATSGRISPENLLLIDQSWQRLIDEMQNFVNTIWTQFENWKSENIVPSYVSLSPKEVASINKRTTAMKRANGDAYCVVINSHYGGKLLSLCKSLDSCLVVLHGTLKVCDESIKINNLVKKYYFAILKKIVSQYKKDSEILENALKRKPRFIKKKKTAF